MEGVLGYNHRVRPALLPCILISFVAYNNCRLGFRMTIKQHTPIKGDKSMLSIGLGSKYAHQLGLEGVEEYNALTVAEEDSSAETQGFVEESGGKKTTGKKKKKKNNKKKH
jgi:hypothetical protein